MRRPAVEGAPGDPLRFVVPALVAAAGLLLAVLAFNAVVDPYGRLGTALFPTLIPTDRPVKVALMKRLVQPPALIVFGSSRALKVDPAYLRRRLGQPGFNAAVSDGQPEDAWAFLNYIHSRFPRSRPHYLWLIDVEAFRDVPDNGVLDTPELARYLPFGYRWHRRLGAVWPLLSWREAKASLRVLRRTTFGPPLRLGSTAFAPNGFRRYDVHDAAFARGSTLPQQLRASEALYARVYRRYRRLSPTQERYFEKTLASMETWGDPPVIVLTPIHPAMRRALAPLGWSERRREVLAYLHELQRRHRFRLLDMTSLSSFGGSPNDFYDGLHLTLPNMQRLLDTIVRRERRAL